jgi:pimeloyl-ACP methyl ester carboxylesterase
VHVVGHALGNAIARATAAYEPSSVRSLALLACGGHDLERLSPPAEVTSAFERCHDPSLPEGERLQALQTAFFAVGNDPRPWLDGWWPGGRAIGNALRSSDWRQWWLGGHVPVLVLQPLEDAMGPPVVGRELAGALGGRARYIEIPGCGHAILPERREEVSRLVAEFIVDVDEGSGPRGP